MLPCERQYAFQKQKSFSSDLLNNEETSEILFMEHANLTGVVLGYFRNW